MIARLVLAALVLAAGTPAVERKPQTPSTPVRIEPLIASVDNLPIGSIPRQELPVGKCAAFLWTQTETRALVAMVTTEPAQIRFAPGGTLTDLTRVSANGEGGLGFANVSEYAGGDLRVVIDMTVTVRDDLKSGAVVSGATMRIDRSGADTVIVPVVGIIGCG